MSTGQDTMQPQSCRTSGWGRQFGRPRGWRGSAVGRLMAIKNARMSRTAVEMLGLDPSSRVLEIGFGPGVAIAAAAARVSAGLVAGVDRSDVMLHQATRRNRRAIADGRVELRLASAERLPYRDRAFTHVFEINSFHHWDDAGAGLAEVRRVLVDGGRLTLCLRLAHPTRSFLVAPGYAGEEVERVRETVRAAGFDDLRVLRSEAGRAIACVTGIRRG